MRTPVAALLDTPTSLAHAPPRHADAASERVAPAAIAAAGAPRTRSFRDARRYGVRSCAPLLCNLPLGSLMLPDSISFLLVLSLVSEFTSEALAP
eukprot:434268-Pleurochrysis_carterae.AAC.1